MCERASKEAKKEQRRRVSESTSEKEKSEYKLKRESAKVIERRKSAAERIVREGEGKKGGK